MAKLNRERKLLERRQEKQARKDARKRESAQDPGPLSDTPAGAAEPERARQDSNL